MHDFYLKQSISTIAPSSTTGKILTADPTQHKGKEALRDLMKCA